MNETQTNLKYPILCYSQRPKPAIQRKLWIFHCWKTVWNFLGKLKMELPFDPAIPLLGLYPKNSEKAI